LHWDDAAAWRKDSSRWLPGQTQKLELEREIRILRSPEQNETVSARVNLRAAVFLWLAAQSCSVKMFAISSDNHTWLTASITIVSGFYLYLVISSVTELVKFRA